jgi:hypothetical protein
MHIATDVPAYTMANMTVPGTSLRIVKSYTTINDTDTMSCDAVVAANPGTVFRVSTGYASSSSVFDIPTWVAFRLDNYFSPLVAFSVACSSRIGGESLNIAVPFDIEFVDTANAWSSTTKQFTAPQTGIYVFKFSGGVIFDTTYLMGLFVDGSVKAAIETGIAKFLANSSTALDVVGTTAMLPVSAGSAVTVMLIRFTGYDLQPVYSDPVNLLTTFSGFMYSPYIAQQVRSCYYY